MSLPASIAALPNRTADLVNLLESWANINSGSGHIAGLERMRIRLREDFAHAFPNAQIDEPTLEGTPAKAVRIVMRPTVARRVLLHGHYDTVYEANDAFQTCTRPDANTLRGPGVIDMKGGILVILAALQAFEATPRAAEVGWEVLITPDEEIGSHGSKLLFRETARRHAFALLYEPARPNGDIVHSRKGTGGFTVTCHGRAAHAAKVPNDGRSAILALAEFLLAAAKIPAELPGVMLNVGNIRGGGPATNVVPDFAESELDVRITRVADRQMLLDRLQILAGEINARDGLRLELRGGFNRPPKECNPAEEHVFAAWQNAARDVGIKPFTWVHTGGASDGNLFSAEGLPNLDGLGPIGDHLHSNREFITVNSIAPRAQVTALFLHRLATGEATLLPRP